MCIVLFLPAKRKLTRKTGRGEDAQNNNLFTTRRTRTLSRVFPPGGAWPRAQCLYDQRSQGITVTTEINGNLAASSNVSTVYGAIGINLNQFGHSGDYTALFDQYRIREIEAWIFPPVNMSTEATQESSFWISVIDLDDASNPSSYSRLSGNPTAIQTGILAAHYHKFKPCVDPAVFGGSTFSAYGAVEDMWIDSASPAVPHYGLKFAIGATATNGLVFSYVLRATIQFRGIIA